MMKKKILFFVILFQVLLLSMLFIFPVQIYGGGGSAHIATENGVLGQAIDISLYVENYKGCHWEALIDGNHIGGGTVSSQMWLKHLTWEATSAGDHEAKIKISNVGPLASEDNMFHIVGPGDPIGDRFSLTIYEGHKDEVTKFELHAINQEGEPFIFSLVNADTLVEFPHVTGTIGIFDWTIELEYVLGSNYEAMFIVPDRGDFGWQEIEWFNISSEAESVWVRTQEMTCKQVWVNEDNKFQFSFIYPYRDNNWVRIYDMAGNMVYEIDMPYDNPNIIVDLPNGTYTVKTFTAGSTEPIQTFVIGK
jgi:hypothetical protein